MKKQSKESLVFILLAYGLPLVLSSLFIYGKNKGLDTSFLAQFQMLTPALGAIICLLYTKDRGQAYPKTPFFLYLGGSLVYLALSVFAIMDPNSLASKVSTSFLALWSLCFLLSIYKEKSGIKKAYKLDLPSVKSTLKALGLFLILYFFRALVATSLDPGLSTFVSYFTWKKLIYLGLLIINLPLTLVFFFGEEYGWRAYLQPRLQETFGQVGGLCFLGLAWALWHLPLNLFYYSSQGTGLLSLVNQVFVCLPYSFFFAFSYSYSKSIWAPVLIHYFNNNLILFFTDKLDASILQDQVFTWEMILVNGLLMLVFFAPFVFSNYVKKEAYRPPHLPKSWYKDSLF